MCFQYRYFLSWCESFGCAMNRMMECKLIESKIDLDILIDPYKWVISLNTFDEYGYFIECDIDVSIECHGYFNNLSFFSDQNVGVCSIGILKYGKENDRYHGWKRWIERNWIVIHSEEGILSIHQIPFIFEYMNLLID